MRFDYYPDAPEGAVLFDFDYEKSFSKLGISIDANFSTASSSSTHIYGTSSRVRSSDFEEFEYVNGDHLFSNKTKSISEEGEMVLVKNDDGSVYLVDYLDSYSMRSGDVINGVMLQYREVTPQTTPEPTPEPELTPEPEPEPNPSRGELTEKGWTTDQNSGTWTEARDAANETTDIDGFSLFVRKGVTANTLGGNDKLIIDNEIGGGLEVKGTMRMGDGHDLIDVSVTNSPFGIENHGKIDMGNSDDVIVCSTVRVRGTDEDALINYKTIKMGDGDDLIDARHGGLGGDGKIKMGKGDDEFSDFGDMKLVDGGAGEDKLRLGAGVYSVMKKGSNYRLAKGNGKLDIKNFEQVGSICSRDDEFLDFGSNKVQFGMVIDQHGVTFI